MIAVTGKGVGKMPVAEERPQRHTVGAVLIISVMILTMLVNQLSPFGRGTAVTQQGQIVDISRTAGGTLLIIATESGKLNCTCQGAECQDDRSLRPQMPVEVIQVRYRFARDTCNVRLLADDSSYPGAMTRRGFSFF